MLLKVKSNSLKANAVVAKADGYWWTPLETLKTVHRPGNQTRVEAARGSSDIKREVMEELQEES